MVNKRDSVNEKRRVPYALQNLLQYDVLLTNKFCQTVDKIVPRNFRSHYKALEISCHGIPWFVGWLAFIWLWDSPSMYQMQVNFYLGLWLDICIVAVVKAFTRRRRPTANQSDMFATFSVDHYSFPSGHATRACYIAHFFSSTYSISSLLQLPLLMWSAAVSVSRVALRRHHILDVAAGAAIGIFESLLIGQLWLGKGTCLWILSILSDEKMEGGDYHV